MLMRVTEKPESASMGPSLIGDGNKDFHRGRQNVVELQWGRP